VGLFFVRHGMPGGHLWLGGSNSLTLGARNGVAEVFFGEVDFIPLKASKCPRINP